MTILCDVDGVVADLLSEWVRRYNAKYDDDLSPEDVTQWEMHKNVKPECGTSVYNFLRMPNLYSSVEPIPGALEGVQELRRRGHRVVYVTASVVGSLDQKARWLKAHGFLENMEDLVMAKDKNLVRGQVLIDDGAHNIETFPGFGLLYEAPHNAEFVWPFRAANWTEVVEKIEEVEHALEAAPERAR